MSLDYTIDLRYVKRLILIDAISPCYLSTPSYYRVDGDSYFLSTENGPEL